MPPSHPFKIALVEFRLRFPEPPFSLEHLNSMSLHCNSSSLLGHVLELYDSRPIFETKIVIFAKERVHCGSRDLVDLP